MPVEPRLDLHTYDPRELKPLLDDFLAEAQAHGFSRVLIIHGKGRGVLRQRVRSLLDQHRSVVGYQDAPPDMGSWGATLVHLQWDAMERTRKGMGVHWESPEARSRRTLPWLQLVLGMVLGMLIGAIILWWH
ncbi:MAG: Smr/MutS family protein [Desulfosoma sp.]